MNTNPNLWGGEYAKGLNVAQTLSAGTILSNLWRVVEGTKDKAIVKKFNYVSALTTGKVCANPPAVSGSNMEDKEVPMIQFNMNENVCKEDFNNTNYAMVQPDGTLNDEIPVEVMQAFLMQLAAMEGENMERIRWSGDTASSDATLALADGIIKIIKAYGVYNVSLNPDGYVYVTPTSGTASVTASTVIAEIQKVVDATPLRVLRQKNFGIIVSPEVARAYQAAVAANVALATWAMGMPAPLTDKGMVFLGYFGTQQIPMYIADGLAIDNPEVIMAGNFSNDFQGNLVLATDALSDFKYVQVTDLQRTTGQPFVNFLWSVRQGYDVMRAEEIVLYHN